MIGFLGNYSNEQIGLLVACGLLIVLILTAFFPFVNRVSKNLERILGSTTEDDTQEDSRAN